MSGELTNNQKGAAAEAVVAAEAIKLGIGVYQPQSGHSRADLIFEIGDDLYRVQVKCSRLGPKGDVVVLHTDGSYLSPSGYSRSTYQAGEVDFIATWCPPLDRCFLLPPSIFVGRHAIQLRLVPARNNQKAATHLADRFEFEGAVAQLEERRHGMAEARGSSPLSSTSSSDQLPARILGADQASRTWGTLLEEVAAGEEIVITRRGTPKVRMSPA